MNNLILDNNRLNYISSFIIYSYNNTGMCHKFLKEILFVVKEMSIKMNVLILPIILLTIYVLS